MTAADVALTELELAIVDIPEELRRCIVELIDAGVPFAYGTWDFCPMSNLARAKKEQECDILGTKADAEKAASDLVPSPSAEGFSVLEVLSSHQYHDDSCYDEEEGAITCGLIAWQEEDNVPIFISDKLRISHDKVRAFAEAWDAYCARLSNEDVLLRTLKGIAPEPAMKALREALT